MGTDAWDTLATAHTALGALQARSSDFISDLLDLLTDHASRNPALLGRVVALRTQAAELNGEFEDALADLDAAIEALNPGDLP